MSCLCSAACASLHCTTSSSILARILATCSSTASSLSANVALGCCTLHSFIPLKTSWANFSHCPSLSPCMCLDLLLPCSGGFYLTFYHPFLSPAKIPRTPSRRALYIFFLFKPSGQRCRLSR